MNLPDLYLLIIAALFSLYGLGAAIENTVALRLLSGDKASQRLFTPLWEVTNVFLVFGFTGIAVIFSNALMSISHAVLSTLAVGLVALLARASLALYIFYSGKANSPAWVRWSFVLASLGVPLSFTAAGAYFLSGQAFWRSWLGWELLAAGFFGLFGVGGYLVDRLLSQRVSQLAEMSYLVWLIFIASLIPFTVLHTNSSLQIAPVAGLSVLGFVGLWAVLGKHTFGWRSSWRLAPALALLAPILLAWSLRPYLVAGSITLASAYSATSYSAVFLIGSAIVLPLLGTGVWLFYKLYTEK